MWEEILRHKLIFAETTGRGSREDFEELMVQFDRCIADGEGALLIAVCR